MLLLLQWLFRVVTSLFATAEKTKVDLANTKVEEEKVQAADRDSARRAAIGMPWWMAVIADMIGTPIALHIGTIAFATTFQPLLAGGWLNWMLHIPPLPAPFDSYEANIVAYFFGTAGAVAVSMNIGSAIIAGMTKRRG